MKKDLQKKLELEELNSLLRFFLPLKIFFISLYP